MLARPNSCHFCSPYCLRHLWPPHISLRLNMVAADPAGSCGSNQSGRAMRSNGRRGEVMALQAASYAQEREREQLQREWWRHWHRELLRYSLGQICMVVKGYWADCRLGFLLLPVLFFFFSFFFLQ
jgi:hypothetical protein